MAKLPNKKEVKDTTVGVKNLGAALSELEKPLENVAKSFTQMLDKSKEILDNNLDTLGMLGFDNKYDALAVVYQMTDQVYKEGFNEK